MTLGGSGKNKANSKPNKANFTRNKANSNPKQTQYKPKQSQFQRQKMLLRLPINGRSLLWIPAFAAMTAISRVGDVRWILVDCWYGIVDNRWVKIENLIV